jgi:hypothetical protein
MSFYRKIITKNNNSLFFIGILAISGFLLCAHIHILNPDAVFHHADGIAQSLRTGAITPQSVKNLKVGKSGYYYILDNEGTVIAHPNASIEGINVSGIPLVQRAAEKKSGCFIQFFDGMEKVVVFRNAGTHGTLILTVSRDDISGPISGCERLE